MKKIILGALLSAMAGLYSHPPAQPERITLDTGTGVVNANQILAQ